MCKKKKARVPDHVIDDFFSNGLVRFFIWSTVLGVVALFFLICMMIEGTI